MRLAVDIESDGLLDTISKIHCIAFTDIDTGKSQGFGPDALHDALAALDRAKLLVLHNGIGFDIPALERVLGWSPKCPWMDTLLLAKVIHSDLANEDYKASRKAVKALNGSHSLKAWGVRLKMHKGDYGEQENAWADFSESMLSYNIQDTVVTAALFKHLESEGYSKEAYDLEHRFAQITFEMEQRGFTLNVEKTQALYDEIKTAQNRITAELQRDIPGVSQETKTPAYYRITWADGSHSDFPTKGIADTERKARKVKPKDCKIEPGPVKVNYTPFNPGSRAQIRKFLWERYGWSSPELTDSGFLAVLQKRSPLLKETLQNVNDLAKYLKKNFGTPDPTVEEIAEFSPVYGKINEETLSECPYPEGEKFARYLTMGKRLGQIGDGENAWLKLVKDDGKIHHRFNTIGCATFRGSHASPNLGQVPKVEKGKDENKVEYVKKGEDGGWGYECRDCFEATEGYDLVGADLSGIEACMLAHFLHPFDGGEFVDTLINGDIHQKNADAMSDVFGFEILRNDTKSPFYATMYGGGVVKLGRTLARDNKNAKQHHVELVEKYRRSLSEAEAIKEAYLEIGKKVKEGLERGIRGLTDLQAAVKRVAERGYLQPLDGRHIPIRSPHSALNSLLQGTAAIVMKRWIVLTFEEVKRLGWDCHLLAVVHDEAQTETRPQYTESFRDLILSKIPEAGKYYKLKCPLSGEAKIGKSWSSTH